jgi:hypothetical protein
LGFKVSGKVAPETVKPAPATAIALTVTGALPVEERVRVCAVAVLTFTVPKVRLDGLTLNVGTAAPSCNGNVVATLFALAVRVTV